MPSRYSAHFSEIGSAVIEELTERNRDREQALAVSREVIRFSANAIRAVHRGDFDAARELIGKGAARLQEADHIKNSSPQIFNAGFMNDARKEFTEANVTLAVISGSDIPSINDLGVDAAAYINGMAEVIGELRRYILDALRRDAVDGCQEFMDIMDEMYSVLVTIDFPEGVTSGLRHNTDAMRGVLERTRGDLTMALRQHSLEARLADWEKNQAG
ncbi:MAG TPA: haloacid dehalogenase [Dehalococcoidia bacterium]|nr:haloacid dehalogenase [Dehalococcoidia bacterium]